MKGRKWQKKDLLVVFGMKSVKFLLDAEESKTLVLFALANSLGVKKFPQILLNCSHLDQQFEISSLRPVSVNFK